MGLALAVHREVAEALDELLRLQRVGHVDERDAADALVVAGADLVVVDEQVAFEEARGERDDLRALAGVAAGSGMYGPSFGLAGSEMSTTWTAPRSHVGSRKTV